MPFVEKSHRDRPDLSVPGDRCYLYYKHMVETWTKSPRWTTADEIYGRLLVAKQLCRNDLLSVSCEMCRAHDLAWQVFFSIYVMDYERKKRDENGDI